MKQRSYWSADGKPPEDLPWCFNQMPYEEFCRRFPVDSADLPSAEERRSRLLAKLMEDDPSPSPLLLPLLFGED